MPMLAEATNILLPAEGDTDRSASCQARGHQLAEAVLRIDKGPLEEVTGPIESHLKVLDLPLDEPVPYKRALELAEGRSARCGPEGLSRSAARHKLDSGTAAPLQAGDSISEKNLRVRLYRRRVPGA